MKTERRVDSETIPNGNGNKPVPQLRVTGVKLKDHRPENCGKERPSSAVIEAYVMLSVNDVSDEVMYVVLMVVVLGDAPPDI